MKIVNVQPRQMLNPNTGKARTLTSVTFELDLSYAPDVQRAIQQLQFMALNQPEAVPINLTIIKRYGLTKAV